MNMPMIPKSMCCLPSLLFAPVWMARMNVNNPNMKYRKPKETTASVAGVSMRSLKRWNSSMDYAA